MRGARTRHPWARDIMVRSRDCSRAEPAVTRADLEQRLAQREAALGELSADVETFTRAVVHDLRAPLRNMHNLAQALEEDYAASLDAGARCYIERIQQAALRMDGLLTDLLAYSRIGREAAAFRPVSIDAALGCVLGELEAQVLATGARIDVESAHAEVLGHAPTVQLALGQVLANALKFRRPGHPPGVRVHHEARPGMLRTWIEDDGIGIAPAHRQRIFQVFERLHGEEAYPGSGIGLAMVRKALRWMHGEVGIEGATSGPGSRFWIELPIALRSGALHADLDIP